MKKRTINLSIMNIFRLTVFVLAVGLVSCQKEEVEFVDQNDQQETITADSTLKNLIARTAQNDGDIDDIIDGSDCIEVQLPITVIANGQKIVIEDEDDLDIIEDIFDQFPNDDDILEIIFPITV